MNKIINLGRLSLTGFAALLLLVTDGPIAVAAKGPKASATPYHLVVVPRQSRVQLHRQWSPFTQALTRELGREVRLVIPGSFAEFESLLNRGQADLVYLNPYQAVVYQHRTGYRPLLRDGSRNLVGIMVVRQDHPARKLADLPKPVRAGFPDPNAFAASLYVRAILSERERLQYQPSYLGTHANVFRHVLHGQIDAGGSVMHTLEREPPEVRDRLRVLYRTPPFATHPLCVHPRLTVREQRAIIEAVQRLSRKPGGREVLDAVNLHQPVVARYDRDYRPLESLRLERYYAQRRPERVRP